VTGVYAAALLRQVARVLRLVPEGEQAAALAPLEGFLAAPRADTFVAATRALAQLTRAHATRRLLSRHDDRLFRRGLDAVRGVAGAGPDYAEVLADLPMDARTGQRLLALAQLLSAHAELTGRAAAAFRAIRRKLEPSAPPSARTWRDA
jgi:hypothetical protein